MDINDIKALALETQDDLDEAKNFVTAILTVTSDQAQAHYQKLRDQSTYYTITADYFLAASRYTFE